MTVEREQLNVVFDQVGTPTYAADLAALIVHVLETGKYRQHQGIYHFSNEGVCSWYDFAKEIVALSGNTCDIRPCHSDEFPGKVKRDFDCTIPYWKDSLVKCINELKRK